MSKWILVALLGLQVHFAASFLVALGERSRRPAALVLAVGIRRWRTAGPDYYSGFPDRRILPRHGGGRRAPARDAVSSGLMDSIGVVARAHYCRRGAPAVLDGVIFRPNKSDSGGVRPGHAVRFNEPPDGLRARMKEVSVSAGVAAAHCAQIRRRSGEPIRQLRNRLSPSWLPQPSECTA
jgi:hypothetical protein